MVRVARQGSPTDYYHIMSRGNNRETIFIKKEEKRYYEELLQTQIEGKKISVVAYCLMDNHVHLLINSDLPEMIEAIRWVNNKFASRYNFKYERVGHVFQGRFKSEIIDTEKYLIQAIRYIHNNPVKAGIVAKPSEYDWSSYNGYLDEAKSLLNEGERQKILEVFAFSTDEFISFHMEEETEEFLETEEDLEKEREEKAKNIISKYQRENLLTGESELYSGKANLEKLIIELLKESRLSHRRISELVNVSRGIVHGMAKKI